MSYFDSFTVGREQAFGVTIEVPVPIIGIGGHGRKRRVQKEVEVSKRIFLLGKSVFIINNDLEVKGALINNLSFQTNIEGVLFTDYKLNIGINGISIFPIEYNFNANGYQVIYDHKVYKCVGVKNYRLILELLEDEEEE